jgi:hypothetical protein
VEAEDSSHVADEGSVDILEESRDCVSHLGGSREEVMICEACQLRGPKPGTRFVLWNRVSSVVD